MEPAFGAKSPLTRLKVASQRWHHCEAKMAAGHLATFTFASADGRRKTGRDQYSRRRPGHMGMAKRRGFQTIGGPVFFRPQLLKCAAFCCLFDLGFGEQTWEAEAEAGEEAECCVFCLPKKMWERGKLNKNNTTKKTYLWSALRYSNCRQT